MSLRDYNEVYRDFLKSLFNIEFPNGVQLIESMNYYKTPKSFKYSTTITYKPNPFFRRYVLKAEGEILSVLDGEIFLGANGEALCIWRDEYNDLNDSQITKRIIDGKLKLEFNTERGKDIYDFIQKFKRLPNEEELERISDFMNTYRSLK